MALYYGPLAWLYIWRDNSRKFIVSIFVCAIMATVAFAAMSSDRAAAVIVPFLWFVGVWLWTILAILAKPRSYFWDYDTT
jgi:hypothetical protein